MTVTYPNVRITILDMNKPSKPDINEAASALGKRSAEVRQKKWGKREFVKKMREWGALGGRPKNDAKDKKGKEKQ